MFYRITTKSFTTFLGALLLLAGLKASAQVTLFSGNNLWESNAPTSCYSETLIFKADAKIYMRDGSTFYFYGKNLVIEQGAKFYGVSADGATVNLGRGGGGVPGFIALVSSPSNSYTNSSGASVPSTVLKTVNGGYVDGAGDANTIPCLWFSNAENIQLVGNDVRVGTSVIFDAAQPAVVILGNQNFRLSGEATVTGSGANRYFNTTGTGYLVKESLASASSFSFPVGFNVINDLTPATVVNNESSPASFYVNVKDIAGSAATLGGNVNINRIWNIFCQETTANATVSLQHNHQTNSLGNATSSPAFDNTKAFASQQTATEGRWSLGTASNGGSPVSTHSGSFTIPQTNGVTAYFTKLLCSQAFNVTGGGSYCAGGAVGLDGSEFGIEYQLLLNGTPIGNPIVGTGSEVSFGVQTTTGTYTVIELSSACAVTMNGNAVVTVNPVPAVAISKTINTESSNVTLTASGAESYIWTTIDGKFLSNEASITFKPIETNVYVVTGTNTYGCSASARITVSDETRSLYPEFPSGITPNGDGMNDSFIIRNVELFPENEIMIYNRWGDIVYKKTNYTNSDAWTGVNMSGKPLPEGTYFVVFKVLTSSFDYSGWVYIIRD